MVDGHRLSRDRALPRQIGDDEAHRSISSQSAKDAGRGERATVARDIAALARDERLERDEISKPVAGILASADPMKSLSAPPLDATRVRVALSWAELPRAGLASGAKRAECSS
jgi:hypothetical protein